MVREKEVVRDCGGREEDSREPSDLGSKVRDSLLWGAHVSGSPFSGQEMLQGWGGWTTLDTMVASGQCLKCRTLVASAPWKERPVPVENLARARASGPARLGS